MPANIHPQAQPRGKQQAPHVSFQPNKVRSQPRRVLRIAEVLQRVGIGKSKLYDLQINGQFPPCIDIAGSRARGFDSYQIDDYVDHLFASTTGSAGC